MAHFSGIRLSMLGAWLAGVKYRVAWYHILSQQLRISKITSGVKA